jgi:hypothetical protein
MATGLVLDASMKLKDIPPIPHLESIPDCEHRQVGQVRIYRKHIGDFHEDTIEALYADGFDSLFWAPLPIVESEK